MQCLKQLLIYISSERLFLYSLFVLYPSSRIWIKRREEFHHKKEKEDVQVLGYRDYKPDRKDDNKIETLDEVINKINALIRDGKFEGRIVSVECLQCESTGNLRFDPEVLTFFSLI